MIVEESHLPIARPASEVFAFVADMTNAPRWQTGLREVRRLEVDPDGQAGSRLTSRVELHITGVMRLARPILSRVLRRDVRRDDEALKALLEGAPAPIESPPPNLSDTARRVTRWAAWVAGATGCAANLLLAAFYAGRGTSVGVQGATEWAGPANDLVGAVSSAAMVPMALGLLTHLGRPRKLVAVTWAAVGAMVALGASSVLLLRDVIPFTAQAAAAVPAVAVLFSWLLLVGRAGRATHHLPDSLSTAAITIGAGLLTALPLLGAAALLPTGSPGQLLLGGIGLALGVAAFLVYPIWLLRLARSLQATPAGIEPTAHHAPQPA